MNLSSSTNSSRRPANRTHLRTNSDRLPRHVKSPSDSSVVDAPPRGRTRGGSVSTVSINPIQWLSKTTSPTRLPPGAGGPYAPSKPVRISEPKLIHNTLGLTNGSRQGALGSGATAPNNNSASTPAPSIVHNYHHREPSAGFRAATGYETLRSAKAEVFDGNQCKEEEEEEEDEGLARSLSPHRPPDANHEQDVSLSSPRPLPPLPEATRSSPDILLRPKQPDGHPHPVPANVPYSPVESTRARFRPPPLKMADLHAPIPPPALTSAISLSVPPTPAQPPFDAILLSPFSPTASAKLLVTLETATSSVRTTLATLTSRPSYLSSYLDTLIRRARAEGNEEGEDRRGSVDSYGSEADSAFNSIFHNHLAEAGVLSPPAVSNMHVFLDRPSAPYTHILTYLRSPLPTPDSPSVLPRPIQLPFPPPPASNRDYAARLETLLEVRDEAAYLGLDELLRLCAEELYRQYQRPASQTMIPIHLATGPSASSHQQHARKNSGGGGSSSQSVTTLDTLREDGEEEEVGVEGEEEAWAWAKEDKDRGGDTYDAKSTASLPVDVGTVPPERRPSITRVGGGGGAKNPPTNARRKAKEEVPVPVPLNVPGLRERLAMRKGHKRNDSGFASVRSGNAATDWI